MDVQEFTDWLQAAPEVRSMMVSAGDGGGLRIVITETFCDATLNVSLDPGDKWDDFAALIGRTTELLAKAKEAADAEAQAET